VTDTLASSTDDEPAWPVATGIFWGLVFVALIGVWKASQEVGVATWWRGPRSAPQPVPVQILPLIAPSVMVIGSMFRWRQLAWVGVGAGLVTAAIGAGDLADMPKLALVQIALGGAGVVFSLAALAARR
jgi:hypothetical protein